MKSIYFFLISLFFLGCNDPTLNDDLHFSDGIYLDKKNRPFSGKTVSYHSDGSIASKSTYVEGKKNGKWYTYGYNNEIIQEGEYWKKNQIASLEILNKISCQYVEVNKWREGNNNYTDVYIYKPNIKLSDSIVSCIKRGMNYVNINIIILK